MNSFEQLLASWANSPNHALDKHGSSPAVSLAKRALIERLIEAPSTPRIPGGILSNAWEWDFVPKAVRAEVFCNCWCFVFNSWGGNPEAKEMAFRGLACLDPEQFAVCEQNCLGLSVAAP